MTTNADDREAGSDATSTTNDDIVSNRPEASENDTPAEEEQVRETEHAQEVAAEERKEGGYQ